MNAITAAASVPPEVKNPGDTAVFTTTASGTGPFSYVWSKNGAPLAGQTMSSLTIAPVTLASAGSYSVAVGGACNSVTNSTTLRVNTPTTATNAVSNISGCPGDNEAFNTAASGTGPFSYVWSFNGTPLLAARRTAALPLMPIVATNAGTYSVVTTGAANSVTNDVVLTVNTPTTAATLTQFPNGVCPGSSVTFSTVASGTGPFTLCLEQERQCCWLARPAAA